MNTSDISKERFSRLWLLMVCVLGIGMCVGYLSSARQTEKVNAYAVNQQEEFQRRSNLVAGILSEVERYTTPEWWRYESIDKEDMMVFRSSTGRIQLLHFVYPFSDLAGDEAKNVKIGDRVRFVLRSTADDTIRKVLAGEEKDLNVFELLRITKLPAR